jgi:GAF domain-containing protein/HAMP domain-containing protein
MATEKQSLAETKDKFFSLRAKLILGFSILSAFVSFITARGIYTNMRSQFVDEFRTQFITQSTLIILIAVGLGMFFGYVAGNVLTESIIKLTKGAKDFALGDMNQRIELDTRDEINDLASAFNSMADNIQELVTGLEQRVETRTADLETRSKELETANARIQRRAAQFEALAQVTQNITAIRDLQELLPRITTVISEKFGFYHVGIFLLDDINQYAILSAANSAGGKQMLERNHRLRVGEEGIVGNVTATAKPRIAMDVGADAVFFNNPELPDTHSEMALPLISKNIIVGALDVQSTETAAFTTEDVQMLSLLADQVSLAIENARIFDDSRKALAESEMVSRRNIRDAWHRLPEQQKILGYRYNVTGATPLKAPVKLTDPNSDKKNKGKQAETAHAVVPIALRGETIGTLVVQSPSENKWNEDQLDLIRAVAERVALSAENARLFEETTARAEREKLVSDITSKIRGHTDPQAMIQTAIDELRSALGASRVEIIPQAIKGSERHEA